MKTSITFFLTILLCLGMLVRPASAQTFIRIDEGLKSNSKVMRAKRKGISAVGKYEFGKYKVVSGKAGWTKTTQKSPLFSDNSSMKSSSNLSFVLVRDGADSVLASLSVAENVEIDGGSWLIRTFTNWSDAEVKHGEGIFETVLEFSGDTLAWDMVVIYPLSVEVDGMFQMDDHSHFRGFLSNNQRHIEISVISEREDGKNSLLNPYLGYEFWEGSKSLAAVQVMPGNKWFVWIREDLDPQLKFVLAGAATALLVNTF